MVYIVCGVSGTGKTTVGKILANHLGLPFFDADDFHSEANVQKMAKGTPLNDADRVEWLSDLSSEILKWEKQGGAVLACSALKEQYRQQLVVDTHSNVKWIVLEGDRELILSRMKQRKGHFFSAEMLDSQFEIYERPGYGQIYDIKSTPDQIVAEVIKSVS